MLSSAQRLRRSSDFSHALRSGRRAASGRVVAHVVALPSIPQGANSALDAVNADVCEATPCEAHARVGLIVSKAVGGAVQRNLVKRRLRVIAREFLTNQGESPQHPHHNPRHDIVLRALPGAAEADFGTFSQDVVRALRKAWPAAAGASSGTASTHRRGRR